MAIRIPIVSSFSDSGFKDANRALDRLEKTGGAAGKWASATKLADKSTQALNGALVGVAAGGALAVKAASEQEQAFGALDSVYKKNAGEMRSWAAQQKNIGLSAAEAGNQAAYLGSMLKGSGASTKEAADQSKRLIGLGADLAATYGGTASDAVSALGAAMRGEFDPMEQFGVSIKKADINARLAAQGQSKLKGEAKTAAEAAALSALIWEKTSDAQGQAAREADTAAAANARATAAMTDAAASIATSFLPVAAAAAGKLATLAGWLSEHPKLVYGVVGALVALRVIIALNSAAMAIYMQRAVFMAAASKAAAAAQWLLNVALNANPIGLIVAAVALLIAGIVLLWKKNEGFRNFMKTAWSAITSAVKTSIDAVTGPLQRFIDKLQAIWDKVQKVKNVAGGLLGGLNPFRGADSGGFAAAGSFTTGGGFTRGGVTVGQLVYNGSGDVAADGRTLRALLESGDITQGRPAGAPRRVAW